MPCIYQTLQHLLNSWQGVGVHLCMHIQVAEVNTES